MVPYYCKISPLKINVQPHPYMPRHYLNFLFYCFQPLARWRRTARIVRLLCGVCIALRKYAMDAGLMENYMVNVTRKAHSKDGDLNDLTFNLKDFKIKKEVSKELQQSSADLHFTLRYQKFLHPVDPRR